MIRINFGHLDEDLELNKSQCNVLVIENSAVYAKAIYSLYNRDNDYFKIYDEKFKILSEKETITILNPLLFDFDNRNIKTLLYNHIMENINLDTVFKSKMEEQYRNIISSVEKFFMENIDVDFSFQHEIDIKELLKFVGLNVNQESENSFFDKVQSIINLLNEIAENRLLIFANLNVFLTKEEYLFIVEQIKLNSQMVLLMEGSENNLETIPHYLLDNDFFLAKYDIII